MMMLGNATIAYVLFHRKDNFPEVVILSSILIFTLAIVILGISDFKI